MIIVDSSVWIDFLKGRSVPHVARLLALFGAYRRLLAPI
jgi:predicted nucleic acid-binding protein